MDLKKDLLWWKQFMTMFNEVELIIPATVSCNVLGDATPTGGGAWNPPERVLDCPCSGENLGQFLVRQESGNTL